MFVLRQQLGVPQNVLATARRKQLIVAFQHGCLKTLVAPHISLWVDEDSGRRR